MYQIPPDEFPEGDTKYRTDLTEAKSSTSGRTKDHDPVGVVALVLGIIAVLSVWNLYLGLVIGLAAVVTGIIATKRAQAKNKGVGIGIASVVMGIVAVILTLILTFIFFKLFDQAHGNAVIAANKADANSVMLAVENFQNQNNGEAPAKLADLEPDYLSAIPGTVQYYRDPFDKTKYRVCTSTNGDFFKCENGGCAEVEDCGSF